MKKLFLFVLSFIMIISTFAVVNFSYKDEVVTANAETVSEVDVYFIAGQSNAAGYSYHTRGKCLNFSTNMSDERINKFYSGFDNVLYMGRADNIFYNELTRVTAGMGVGISQIGPELGLAEVLDAIYEGTNKKAVIIKYALGASSIIGIPGNEKGNWCAPSYLAKPGVTVVGENLYDKMVGTSSEEFTDGFIWKSLMEMKGAGYKKVNFKGLLWAQGEAECNGNMHTRHQEGFECFINDFRSNVTTIAEVAMTRYANFEVSDASNLDFLISEVCPTFINASETADHMSSNIYINSVINQQRAIAKKDENVVTMTTHEYLIRENKEGMASLDRSQSFCNDPYHYNADDMVDIGNRAAEIMYYFSGGESIEVEQATGLWAKIDGKVARRTVNQDGTETFKLLVGSNATVIIDKTNQSVTINCNKDYKIKEIGFYVNHASVMQTNNALVLNDNTVTLPDSFMNLVSKNQVIFFAVNLERIPSRALSANIDSKLMVEGIKAYDTYIVGETVSFKVYFAYANLVGKYGLKTVTYNGVELVADDDGYFTFVVSDDPNCDIIIKTVTISSVPNKYQNYEIELHPSVDAGEPNVPPTETPDDPSTETPDNNSGGGMNCQMGIGSASVLFTIIACLGAIVIFTKRFIKSK